VPLWGAISSAGFHEIVFHKTKKLNKEESVAAMKAGKVTAAVKKLQPGRQEGPRRILCDNESFLEVKECKAYYKSKHWQLLHTPPRCPDFNPIESFWGWLRQELRRRDLEDLRSKRPSMGKAAYKQRINAVLKSKKAQTVAKAKFNNFKKVCKEVARKKGAASWS
jgi:transposase